jgi:DNA-directed RNA polymerase beta subunit
MFVEYDEVEEDDMRDAEDEEAMREEDIRDDEDVEEEAIRDEEEEAILELGAEAEEEDIVVDGFAEKDNMGNPAFELWREWGREVERGAARDMCIS